MGQAKQRGTFEDRVAQANARWSVEKARRLADARAQADAKDDRRYARRHTSSLMAAAVGMIFSPRF